MKRKFPLYGAVLAGMLYLAPTSASAEDLSKHWAYHEMNYLITNDLMKGDEFGNYRPNDAVTRAEFAAFLVRTLNLPVASSNATFSDVKKGDWYYGVIEQASYHGLIKGDEQGKFNPNDHINRQEMAAMLKGLSITKTSTQLPPLLRLVIMLVLPNGPMQMYKLSSRQDYLSGSLIINLHLLPKQLVPRQLLCSIV